MQNRIEDYVADLQHRAGVYLTEVQVRTEKGREHMQAHPDDKEAQKLLDWLEGQDNCLKYALSALAGPEIILPVPPNGQPVFLVVTRTEAK